MILYIDPVGGLAGDMLLGALVDAGWPEARLHALPRALGLEGRVAVAVERTLRGPLSAVRVAVTPLEADPPGRTLPVIEELLAASALEPAVRAAAVKVFRLLAEAEAAAHGAPIEAVHFHEVGALDALVDIAGAAQGLHELGVEELWCGELPAGAGWIDSLHGPLPVPAPATARILALAGASIGGGPPGAAGELVTPTGAAIAAALGRFGRPPMQLRALGLGAGARDTPGWPNVTRVWLGERAAGPQPSPARSVTVLETHIDDATPEALAYAAERLAEAGALDVSMAPVVMKKGRPGVRLTVVAPEELEGALAEAVLAVTPTLGVRARTERRYEAARRVIAVDTPWGAVEVKLKLGPDGPRAVAPEYASCAAVARAHGVTLDQVYDAARTAAWQAAETGTWKEDAVPLSDAPQPWAGIVDAVAQAADWPARLAASVSALSQLPGFDWTGIYLVDGRDLVLGPFVGAPTEHVRIPVGHGLCGAAAAQGESIVVDDVRSDPRYLSCFLTTRSEVVVPIFAAGEAGGRVIGEIDVDSNTPAAFGADHRLGLEAVAAALGGAAPLDPLTGVVLARQLAPWARADAIAEAPQEQR